MTEPHKHTWKEIGRVPVQLVRHTCACGVGRFSVVGKDGRAVTFKIPILGKVNPEALAKMQAGLSIGKELVSLWERVKAAVT